MKTKFLPKSTIKKRKAILMNALQPCYDAHSGAKRNERYNETSVLMKCTVWMV